MNPVTSLYIHFPLCIHLCNYCDFYKHKLTSESQVVSFENLIEAQFIEHKLLLNSVPLFIGWRYFLSRRGDRFIALVSLFSLLGMVMGVASLIVVNAVMNGFEAARVIQKGNVKTEIIFLTMHKDEDLFNEAIDLGAKGFVLKDSALGDIVECIKTVAQSEHFASHALTSFLINRTKRAIQMTETAPSLNDLTPTERKVVKLIADNMTSNDIGEELNISPRTVDKHRSNICKKLDLTGSNSLLKFALSHKSQLL